MRTAAVIARKGGSGKTTLAVHLAIGAHLRGRETMLVDNDPQRSSLETLKGREGGPECVMSSGSKLFALKTAALRQGVQALYFDTPAVVEEEILQAVVLADLAVMVVRPTFLDLAAVTRTSNIVRQLRKPGLIVINQAPAARDGVEPPMVRKAMMALDLLRIPVAPVILRNRTPYQTAIGRGLSVEESDPGEPAGLEMAELCNFIDRFLFGAARSEAAAGR